MSGRMILKRFLKKYFVMLWTGLMQVRIEFGVGLLGLRKCNFGLYNRQGMY
jgi:hypothetical protein